MASPALDGRELEGLGATESKSAASDGVAVDRATSEGADEAGLVEVLRRVDEAHRLPVGAGFRQQIVLRAFLLTWRFESQVEVTSQGFRSQTTGAPAFVPDTLPEELVELSQSAAMFDLSLVTSADGDALILKGPRKEYPGTGPMEATLWVDPVDWVVTRAEAVYSWGTLHVTQEFERRDGITLLARQRARITPYGLTLDVEYRDYQIP